MGNGAALGRAGRADEVDRRDADSHGDVPASPTPDTKEPQAWRLNRETLGTNGVVAKFPKFTQAIKAKDWATAAKESNRPQVNSHRNQTVKAWLETALTDSASLHIDAYGRRWHGSYPFHLTAIRQYAPNSVGVYQILHSKGPAEQVAYIGIATGDTIRGRLTKHASGRGNWALARLGDPASFSFIYFQCDAKTAKQIESHVISTKKPPFNTRPEYRDFIPSIAVH